jgi:hypothetical protein
MGIIRELGDGETDREDSVRPADYFCHHDRYERYIYMGSAIKYNLRSILHGYEFLSQLTVASADKTGDVWISYMSLKKITKPTKILGHSSFILDVVRAFLVACSCIEMLLLQSNQLILSSGVE